MKIQIHSTKSVHMKVHMTYSLSCSIKLQFSFAEYSLFYRAFTKLTYNLIDPTNRSHPIPRVAINAGTPGAVSCAISCAILCVHMK